VSIGLRGRACKRAVGEGEVVLAGCVLFVKRVGLALGPASCRSVVYFPNSGKLRVIGPRSTSPVRPSCLLARGAGVGVRVADKTAGVDSF
jgi:hypothetical protein